MGLTKEEIAQLIAPKERKSRPVIGRIPFPHYAPPPQVGPLRFYDVTLRCQHLRSESESKIRCGSPTAYKFQGIALCTTHLLQAMNNTLIELGVE